MWKAQRFQFKTAIGILLSVLKIPNVVDKLPVLLQQFSNWRGVYLGISIVMGIPLLFLKHVIPVVWSSADEEDLPTRVVDLKMHVT